jgi:hypothetical protein
MLRRGRGRGRDGAVADVVDHRLELVEVPRELREILRLLRSLRSLRGGGASCVVLRALLRGGRLRLLRPLLLLLLIRRRRRLLLLLHLLERFRSLVRVVLELLARVRGDLLRVALILEPRHLCGPLRPRRGRCRDRRAPLRDAALGELQTLEELRAALPPRGRARLLAPDAANAPDLVAAVAAVAHAVVDARRRQIFRLAAAVAAVEAPVSARGRPGLVHAVRAVAVLVVDLRRVQDDASVVAREAIGRAIRREERRVHAEEVDGRPR